MKNLIKVIKRIYKVLMVIVFVYFGSYVIIDMVIFPIISKEFPYLFGYIIFYSNNKSGMIDKGDPVYMDKEAITVKTSDLIREFDENEFKTNETYQGKVLKLTGYVYKVKQGFFRDREDNYYLVLVSNFDRPFFENVDIHFREEEVYKLKDLTFGQMVTIIGEYDAKSHILQIKNAFFEKEKT
jgi:hypothetical protein